MNKKLKEELDQLQKLAVDAGLIDAEAVKQRIASETPNVNDDKDFWKQWEDGDIWERPDYTTP